MIGNRDQVVILKETAYHNIGDIVDVQSASLLEVKVHDASGGMVTYLLEDVALWDPKYDFIYPQAKVLVFGREYGIAEVDYAHREVMMYGGVCARFEDLIETDTVKGILFVDLHGVLVDFVAACNTRFKVDIYADPAHHGDWHAPKTVIPDFHKRVSNQSWLFWSGMPLLDYDLPPEAVILTTPWGNGAAYEGTVELVRKHFPNNKVIFTEDKSVLAKGNTLIDDKDENIQAWRDAGGVGILHPGIMNSGHSL